MEALEHLFRRESGRLVAVLVRVFGVHNLPLAEDVAQDTLWRALEIWKFRGPPDNPSAWLMACAKRRGIDVLRRERTARKFAPELGHLLESEWTLVPSVEELFRSDALADDLLRMMFSCSHPRLAAEARVALILNILCGFSVGEIAGAFLSSKAAIEKRLQRGKALLAGSNQLFDVTDAVETRRRLVSVQRAIYLLFNEGYHGASPESPVRMELCGEAMRLGTLLVSDPHTATPASHALLALIHFHAARLPARIAPSGELKPFAEQDRAQWDHMLSAEGHRLLGLSAEGDSLTDFHIEAAIAGAHARAPRFEDTDWEMIVQLYDRLLVLSPSPVVALNRAISIAQLEGPERGLAELSALSRKDRDRLKGYPFYPATIAELELHRGEPERARTHLLSALELARNNTERHYFEQRLKALS